MHLIHTLQQAFRAKAFPASGLAASLLFLCFTFISGESRADYHNFNVASGADTVIQEVRYPYWEGGTYNAIWSDYVLSSDGPSEYFYGGQVTSPPVYVQWVHWPPGNPLNPGDNPSVIFSGPNMFARRTAFSEGSSAKVSGNWSQMALNQWYRFVIRYWQPADGTPHLGYGGQWMRDSSTGNWYHLATYQYPFAATGIDGLSGFQEDFNGNTNNRRTDYRNCYYRRNGQWQMANQFSCSTRNSNEVANAALIENNTAVYFEINQGGNYTPYAMGPGPGYSVTLTMTNQPTSPSFDPIIVSSSSATVQGSQLLVQWQMAPTSSPQLSYRIEVFNNSSYTGSPVVTVYDHDPEARQKLVTLTGVTTPYVRLTISDIFDNNGTPILITPAAPSLLPASTISGAVNGLGYQYYEAPSGTQWTSIPNFATLTPALQGAVNGIDLTPRRTRSNYAFHFTGYLQVPSDGIYLFALASSHGSTFSIDGTQVINNDGVHDVLAANGSVGLKAGLHALDLQYFFAGQNSDTPDSDSLALSYQGPGITLMPVPASAFYRVPAAGEPSIVLNTPANGITISGANVAWAATAAANGATLNNVQFLVGSNYWGQSLSAPYTLNSLFWSAANNQLRARLFYNSNQTIDSTPNVVTTTNMDVTPWQLAVIGPHNNPVGASTQAGTCSLIGDSLNMLYRQVSGDCTLIAHLADITSAGALPDGSTPDANAEAGIILRNSTDVTLGSPLGDNDSNQFQALFSTVGGSTCYQDGTMYNGGGPYASANLGGANRWYKIQRTGNTFVGSVSTDGVQWTVATTQTLPTMGTVLDVGLFIFTWPSLRPAVHHATFDNVSLTGALIGAPSVTVAPSATTIFAGAAATFNSAVVGTSPYTFQWYRNGNAIPGANGSSLTVSSAQLADSGLYSVTVNTGNGSASSTPASLSVLTPVTTGYAATTLAGGPVAYWHLGETSGTTAIDRAGSFNGTYSNVTLGIAGPQAPAFAGFEANNPAAQFNGASSSVAVPALNLNSNTVTVSGWVKRSGNQAAWSGIFFNRSGSTTAGLHFGTANELRYTWNNAGNTYNWNSGLVPPDGVWTYVALVVQPTKATIYMSKSGSLSSATNNVSHAVQGFTGTGYLGQDSTGGRWFNGTLDEFAVYNQALTAAAIQSQYQAASSAIPSVTLTAPGSGSGYSAPATINLAASGSYTGHTVTAMRFYNGATLLGQSTTAPYSFNWNNVAAGEYTVYAQALFDDGSTMSSGPAFISAYNPPPVPASVTVTALAGNAIGVGWGASSDATSYIVSRNGVVIATVTGTNYVDEGLTSGTPYTYTVVAADQWGNSPASSAASATTLSAGTALLWDADSVTAGTQDGSGNWGTGYTNWLNGPSDIAWPDNVQAVFGAGTGSSNAVTLINDVIPSGITFAGGNYTIAGSNAVNISGSVAVNCLRDGSISATTKGTGALVKAGPAVLTLSGTNSYSGTTTISNGTLQLNGSTLAGSVVNNGTLAFNESAAASYSGVISGSGAVTSVGTGTLTLKSTTASTYSGGTFISAGMLSLGTGGTAANTASAAGLGSGQVTLNAGGMLRLWIKNNSSFTIANGFLFNGGTVRTEDGTYTLSGAIATGSGGMIQTQYGGKPLTFNGVLSGAGNLIVDNASNGYGSTYLALSADNSGYTGSIMANVSSSGWDGGQLSINHNNALKNADLVQNTPRDMVFGSGITAPIFGSLAGVGNLTVPSGVTLTVGNNGHSTTYSGALQGAGAMSKTGAGTLTLAGVSTYTGATNVTGGVLSVGGSLAAGSSVTVAAAGTLAGTGTIQGTVTVNGTIAPGVSNAIGVLTISNNVVLHGTAGIRLSKSGTALSNDQLAGLTSISYGGTLLVTNTGGSALAAGDSFTLFSSGSYAGAFSSISLPALPSTLQWDTSNLPVNGSIAVTVSPWGLWQLQNFTSAQMGNAGVSGLNAAPAGDSVPNLLKFALGLNPMATNPLPVTTDLETVGENVYLRLTVNRNSAATDVTYIVEAASSPATGGWSSAGTVIEVSTPTKLVVRDGTPLTSASSRFARLRVTHP